ncbi:hypothetical protein PBI_GAIA_65 [Mycobacterium phage Gaia]|uniref:Uncharacterized protein n=1 Tax=Mycobacterium phage Gaia TaxID=1486472 RepID=A0A068F2F9_9CAUD|nr:hypothetical protein VC46_gp168 [Mycobacterium phage Gaia]AID58884.1 hypothetical protein PBI_GAIA_65 [Mycobacterium phage Gaia]
MARLELTPVARRPLARLG